MRSIEPGISRFRVCSFGASRNDRAVPGLRLPFNGRIVLRRFGAVVHAVITGDLDDPDIFRCRRGQQLLAEGDTRLDIGRVDKVRELAIAIDAGEGVARPVHRHGKLVAPRFRDQHIGRLAPRGVVVGRAPLGLPDGLSRPRLVDHLRDAQAIVGKHPLPPQRLDMVMLAVDTPRRHGALVLPDLIGQEQIVPRETPEAIEKQAAAHCVQRRLQRCGQR